MQISIGACFNCHIAVPVFFCSRPHVRYTYKTSGLERSDDERSGLKKVRGQEVRPQKVQRRKV